MADYARLRALFMRAYNNVWIQIVFSPCMADGYVFLNDYLHNLKTFFKFTLADLANLTRRLKHRKYAILKRNLCIDDNTLPRVTHLNRLSWKFSNNALSNYF